MDSCHKCGLSFSSNSIREVYTAFAGKEVDPNHREVTKSFTSAWKKLVDEPTVKLSITPKVMMTKSMYLLSICDTEEAMRRQHNGILRRNAISVKKSN